ncbi:MAG: type VI secretion system contractile sheath large subunit [Planctomycetes bacterium]|nr:type VI secretion system contractile sheath large subunit [Planctomycetota bacterium]
MPKPLSFGHVGVELTVGGSPAGEEVGPDTPFRILILGDFSGRRNRGPSLADAPLKNRRPLRVDRDNLDQVLARMGVELQLPVAGPEGARLTLRFTELDDFHPDRLFRRAEVFQAWQDWRSRLSNPATFEAAAEEMRTWMSAGRREEPEPAAEKKPAPEPVPVSSENLLEHILGETPVAGTSAPAAAGGVDWQAYLQKMVEPYTLPRTDTARQAQLTTLVDQAIGRQMRAFLHHPDFQALEAAWRGLDFLVRRLETDGNLKLYVLDVSREELAADLNAVEDLSATGIYKLLVEPTVGTAGGQPWGVLAGLFTFDFRQEDVELLGRLARIAHLTGAPFLGAAQSRLVGCESLAQTPDPDDWNQEDPEGADRWQTLRRLGEASSLGLALPRFLLRLPYGREADPTEQFQFEELAQDSTHESYLWGNPALACTLLLGQAFTRYGWDFRPGMVQDIDDLPIHVYEQDGDKEMKPCAEVVLGLRAAERMADQGLMPLLSVQQQGAVRLGKFQSVAEGNGKLAGRWQ